MSRWWAKDDPKRPDEKTNRKRAERKGKKHYINVLLIAVSVNTVPVRSPTYFQNED